MKEISLNFEKDILNPSPVTKERIKIKGVSIIKM